MRIPDIVCVCPVLHSIPYAPNCYSQTTRGFCIHASNVRLITTAWSCTYVRLCARMWVRASRCVFSVAERVKSRARVSCVSSRYRDSINWIRVIWLHKKDVWIPTNSFLQASFLGLASQDEVARRIARETEPTHRRSARIQPSKSNFHTNLDARTRAAIFNSSLPLRTEDKMESTLYFRSLVRTYPRRFALHVLDAWESTALKQQKKEETVIDI